nr:hypothetical protein [Tanacetum cinerariifolium]
GACSVLGKVVEVMGEVWVRWRKSRKWGTWAGKVWRENWLNMVCLNVGDDGTVWSIYTIGPCGLLRTYKSDLRDCILAAQCSETSLLFARGQSGRTITLVESPNPRIVHETPLFWNRLECLTIWVSEMTPQRRVGRRRQEIEEMNTLSPCRVVRHLAMFEVTPNLGLLGGC